MKKAAVAALALLAGCGEERKDSDNERLSPEQARRYIDRSPAEVIAMPDQF